MPQRLCKILLACCALTLSAQAPHARISEAATLVLAPASFQVSAGNIVSVKVLVNTDGENINTVASTIQFPTDLLQVMSVTKSSSILSLWVQDPSFSNSAGTISFTGGVPAPGFVGQGGEAISIVFKGKKQGKASIIFTDSSVLLNDGMATDALIATKPASMSISGAGAADVPTANMALNLVPEKPIIVSPTNPKQDTWYPSDTATFSWAIPSGVTTVQTLLSKGSTDVPTVSYDGSVSQRTVSDIADGTHYFHLRYQNAAGYSPIAHYKVLIDRTPPERFALNVTEQDTNDVVELKAVDAASGIDSYSIQIDSDPVIHIQRSALTNGQFVLPVRDQGNHTLEAVAYDKAGNHTESHAVYSSSAIIPPTISVSSLTVDRNESVLVKGETKYPGMALRVSVRSEGGSVKTYDTVALADGTYSYQTDPFHESGSATVWSQLILSNGNLGPSSQNIKINIKDGAIVQTSKSILYGSPYVIGALVLLAILLFMLYYGWHRFFGLKRKLQKEANAVVEETHRSFVMFKDELRSQLNKLERLKIDRDLNKKEEKIFKELENNIETIDDFIQKKIKRLK